MPDDDFDELAKYADGLVGGPVLKGLPRTKDYPGDREHEEREVARIVLNHLQYSFSSLKTEPLGAGTIPDVEAVLADGRRIAIEVTEVTDEDFRRQRVERRKEERRLGLTQLEASRLELGGENPTPGHVSRLTIVEWTAERVGLEIRQAIALKDDKADAHRRSVDFSVYSETILAIFTGVEVTADLVTTANSEGNFHSRCFDRVIVVLDYDPRMREFPVVAL